MPLKFNLVGEGGCLGNEPASLNIKISKSPNTQRTENKTTDVVIQQHSCKLLMMDILMSETC